MKTEEVPGDTKVTSVETEDENALNKKNDYKLEKALQRPFDIKESIKIIESYKRKTVRDILTIGLELYWAKLHTYHGEWLPFLVTINLNRYTSSKLMKLARGYMVDTNIIQENDKPNKAAIHLAKHILNTDVATLQLLDMRKFWGVEQSPQPVVKGYPPMQGRIFGVNLFGVLKKLNEQLPKMKPSELDDAIDTLNAWIPLAQSHVEELQKQKNSLTVGRVHDR